MKSMSIKIRDTLRKNIDEKTQNNFHRFFKEEVQCHGVKTAIVRKIATHFWREVKNLEKWDVFDLCEQLLSSDYCEEAFVVNFWLPKMTDRLKPGDWLIFKNWIEKYINNWAKCDGFCNHTVGNFIVKYPEFINDLKKWTQSENRWLWRAAAVSLIVPAKKGHFLTDIFEIADALISDRDDLVQKGYGWLLKVTSHLHQKEVLDYVIRNKHYMSRTALRYAIEKMPQPLRKKAME